MGFVVRHHPPHELVSFSFLFWYVHRNESAPETQGSLRPHGLDEAVRQARVDPLVGRLAHELGPDPVEGRDGAGHEEARQEARAEGRSGVLPGPPGALDHPALGDVVHAHLGGVQDDGPHDVDVDTAVEPGDALVPVHLADEGRERDGFTLVRLAQRLCCCCCVRAGFFWGVGRSQ